MQEPEDEPEEGPPLDSFVLNMKAVVAEFKGIGEAVTRLTLMLHTSGNGTFRYDLLRDDMTESFFSKGWAQKCQKRGLEETKYQPIIYEPRTQSTGSADCLVLAQEWIDRCIRYHKCSVSDQVEGDQNDWYPTRLLDIHDEDEPGFARLAFHSPDKPLIGGYATLSHRWKTETPKYLSKVNMNRKICIQSLPFTFQEAILLTRKLGYRYLWIDTMCIIQTGPGFIEDWNTEASQMANIYARGQVNIVANGNILQKEELTDATDPKVNEGGSVEAVQPPQAQGKGMGLFSQRNYLNLGTSKVEISGALLQNLHPYLESGTFSIMNTSTWADPVDRAPLMARGWVYQERILSPRLLHFCDMQMFWECNELRACESHPNGIPIELSHQKTHIPRLDTFVFGANRPRIEQHMRRGFIEYSFLEPYNKWFEMIQGYTECNLTFDSDILVAISGVASRYSLCLDAKNVYLAGIWSYSLPWGLLWRVHYTMFEFPSTKASYGKPQTKYLAPSWSWASTNSPVVVNKHQLFHRPCVTIDLEKCFCTLLSSNGMNTGVFGAVSSGVLILEGRLTLAKAIRYELRPESQKGDTVLIWVPDRFIEELPETVLCLPIIEQSPETPKEMMASKLWHSVIGITLQEVNKTEGVFQRTGWFQQKQGNDPTWPEIPPLQTITII